jgi:hypothetical protein
MIARLKAWWYYSRTILLNAAIGALVVAGEVVQFLVGFDWTQVLPAKTAGLVVLAINVLNILLRLATKGPVGSK